MRSLLFMGFLLLSGAAWSIPFSTVGSVDRFINSTVLNNSGDKEEVAWVASELGVAAESIDLVFREEDNAQNWQQVDGETDIFAFGLQAEPAYYLIKLGVGNSGADTHYLFENFDELAWAVVNFAEMLEGQPLKFNFGRVSHVAEFSTPEAPAMALLLLGLGLLMARRRR